MVRNIFLDDMIKPPVSKRIDNRIDGVFGEIDDKNWEIRDNPLTPNIIAAEQPNGTWTYSQDNASVSGDPFTGNNSFSNTLYFTYQDTIETLVPINTKVKSVQVSARLVYSRAYGYTPGAAFFEPGLDAYSNDSLAMAQYFYDNGSSGGRFARTREHQLGSSLLPAVRANYSEMSMSLPSTYETRENDIRIITSVNFNPFPSGKYTSFTIRNSDNSVFFDYDIQIPLFIEITVRADRLITDKVQFSYPLNVKKENAIEITGSTLLTTRSYKDTTDNPLTEHIYNTIVVDNDWKSGKSIQQVSTFIREDEPIFSANDLVRLLNASRKDINPSWTPTQLENFINERSFGRKFTTNGMIARTYKVKKNEIDYRGSLVQHITLQEE